MSGFLDFCLDTVLGHGQRQGAIFYFDRLFIHHRRPISTIRSKVTFSLFTDKKMNLVPLSWRNTTCWSFGMASGENCFSFNLVTVNNLV